MKKRLSAIVALAAAALMIGGTATPATALGFNSRNCATFIVFYGSSTQANGGSTYTDDANRSKCGSLGVRIFYNAYPGSPTYYTSWKYAPGYVSQPASGTTNGANHYASSSGITFTT